MTNKMNNSLVPELPHPKWSMWILFIVAVLVRFALTPMNVGEYTDGVLQARQFINPVGIWPPLYTVCIAILQLPVSLFFSNELLWAGRFTSAAFSALSIFPIFMLARRAFGTRAAIYACVFFLTAPVANRWGIRLMTDSTFAFFFWVACERLCVAADDKDQSKAHVALGIACLAMVLSVLTRYQGAMLILPIAACAWIIFRRFKTLPWKPLLFLSGLLLIPLWDFYLDVEFIHGQQFSDRSLGNNPWITAKIITLNAEAFFLYMPYYLTYPVALCAVTGMYWMRLRRGQFFGWLAVYTAVVLLVVQGAFGSFQERYFMPIMGFLWILAGAGMFAIQERWLRRGKTIKKRLFPYFMIGVFAFSGFFSLAVLLMQRESWGDLATASRTVGSLMQADEQIFTNEIYRDSQAMRIAGDKVAFFAGTENVSFLDERFISFNPRIKPQEPMPVGSYVILTSISPVSDVAASQALIAHYRLEEIPQSPFQAVVTPLLPDNTPVGAMMQFTDGTQRPMGFDQNPMGWFLRYDQIPSYTRVFVVQGYR
ncbi:MAG: ArnT family glycosyltransferase [Sumerlaeia bacterium]